jgi:uncharacterized OB-fold protein
MSEQERSQTSPAISLSYCGACDTFMPAWIDRCSTDPAHAVEDVAASGRGTLWTWATYVRQYAMPNELRAPYVVGHIQLEEGPKVNGLLRLPTGTPLTQGAAVTALSMSGPLNPVFTLVTP